MSIIRAEKLTFSYPSSFDPIFENVDFQLDTDWKLGLVGRNGRGKTTLLRLFLGEFEYSGKLIHSVPFDYFPPTVSGGNRRTETVLLEICPFAQEWEFLRELSCLKVAQDVLQRPFTTLSAGEQTKVLLAALFLNEGRFLLIDEPTNHLDAEGRRQIADYLKRKKGFILVSHDRYLLDECTDHIMSLNRNGIEVQSGNYSSWRENFERQQQFESSRNERLKKEISRMKQSARQAAMWSDRTEASKRGAADKGYVGHKAAKMMKRSKAAETRKERAIEEKSGLLKNTEREESLKMQSLIYRSEKLVSFSDVAAVYDGRCVCDPVTFEIRSGERVILCGGNGSGKSSLLKLLLGESAEHTGIITTGSGLKLSYVPQDAEGIKGSLTDFAQMHRLDESLFKTVLRKMGFERVQFEKDMKDFSAGQKKKVMIAKSLCEPAHLYVWDEPLNYIDLYSRIQIEQVIEEFSPAMLLVEHDVYFAEKLNAKAVRLKRRNP